MIKVMIVDDSALIRKILTDILESDSNIKVISTAKNGKEALEKLKTIKPDVITLDIEMPVMDGLTTLPHIVKNYKIPVVMISTLTQEGANQTMKALEEGAVDFLPKPTNMFGLNQDSIKLEVIEKVIGASRTKIKNLPARPVTKKLPSRTNKVKVTTNKKFENLIIIGSSTGGPRALQEVIPELPADINGAILIVQHMPPKFTKSLADRLDTLSNICVKEGEDGELVKRGCAYIAPGGYHMVTESTGKGLILRLNQEDQIMGLRPAVDKLMESVSKVREYNKLGVILTGMGSDGADGVRYMKKSGAYILAQDEKTSVVYGMPKAAYQTNCVDEVVALNKIASKITNKVGV